MANAGTHNGSLGSASEITQKIFSLPKSEELAVQDDKTKETLGPASVAEGGAIAEFDVPVRICGSFHAPLKTLPVTFGSCP